MDYSVEFFRILSFALLIASNVFFKVEGQSSAITYGTKLNNIAKSYGSLNLVNNEDRGLDQSLTFKPYQDIFTVKNAAGDTQQVHYAVDENGVRANFHSNSLQFEPIVESSALRFGTRLNNIPPKDYFLSEPHEFIKAPQYLPIPPVSKLKYTETELPQTVDNTPQHLPVLSISEQKYKETELPQSVIDTPQHLSSPLYSQQKYVKTDIPIQQVFSVPSIPITEELNYYSENYRNFPGLKIDDQSTKIPKSNFKYIPTNKLTIPVEKPQVHDKISGGSNQQDGPSLLSIQAFDSLRETSSKDSFNGNPKFLEYASVNTVQKNKDLKPLIKELPETWLINPVQADNESKQEIPLPTELNTNGIREENIEKKLNIGNVFSWNLKEDGQNVTLQQTKNTPIDISKSSFAWNPQEGGKVLAIKQTTNTKYIPKNILENSKTPSINYFNVSSKTYTSQNKISKSNNFPSIIKLPLSTVFNTSNENGQYYHYTMNLGQSTIKNSPSRTQIFSTGNGLLKILNETGIPYYKSSSKDFTSRDKTINETTTKIKSNTDEFLGTEKIDLEAFDVISDDIFDEPEELLYIPEINNFLSTQTEPFQNVGNLTMKKLIHITTTEKPDNTVLYQTPSSVHTTQNFEQSTMPLAFSEDIFDLDIFDLKANSTSKELEIASSKDDISPTQTIIPDVPLYFFEDFLISSKDLSETSTHQNEYTLEDLSIILENDTVYFDEFTTPSSISTYKTTENFLTTVNEASSTAVLDQNLNETDQQEKETLQVNHLEDENLTTVATETTTQQSFTTLAFSTTTNYTTETTSTATDGETTKLQTDNSLITTIPIKTEATTASTSTSNLEVEEINIDTSDSSLSNATENIKTKMAEQELKPTLELVIQNTQMSDLISRLHNIPMIIRVLNSDNNTFFPAELVSREGKELDIQLTNKMNDTLKVTETNSTDILEIPDTKGTFQELEQKLVLNKEANTTDSPLLPEKKLSTYEDNISQESKLKIKTTKNLQTQKFKNKNSTNSVTLDHNRKLPYSQSSKKVNLTVLPQKQGISKKRKNGKKLEKQDRNSRRSNQRKSKNLPKNKTISSEEFFLKPESYTLLNPKNFNFEKDHPLIAYEILDTAKIGHEIFVEEIPGLYNDPIPNAKTVSQNQPFFYASDYSTQQKSKVKNQAQEKIDLYPAFLNKYVSPNRKLPNQPDFKPSEVKKDKNSNAIRYLDVVPYVDDNQFNIKKSKINSKGAELPPDAVIIIDDYDDTPLNQQENQYIVLEESLADLRDTQLTENPEISNIDFLEPERHAASFTFPRI